MNDEKLKAILEELKRLYPCQYERGRNKTIWAVRDVSILDRVKKEIESLIGEQKDQSNTTA